MGFIGIEVLTRIGGIKGMGFFGVPIMLQELEHSCAPSKP